MARRSLDAQEYRCLYRDKRWCGPHGVRQQALVRDLYTCQRCDCLLVTGNRHHPRAAVVNHIKPHKGDESLFFDLENTEAVCKSCPDTLIQQEEARGCVIGCDVDGRPLGWGLVHIHVISAATRAKADR